MPSIWALVDSRRHQVDNEDEPSHAHVRKGTMTLRGNRGGNVEDKRMVEGLEGGNDGIIF